MSNRLYDDPEFYVRAQKLKIKVILVLLVIVVIAEVYFK